MNILILSQYFWPETFLINDLVKTLNEQGHKIVVATGKPNYPKGDIFENYQSSGVQKQYFHNDIEVIRVPLRARGSGSGKSLFLNYMSFVFSGLFRYPMLLKKYNFDAILVYAPSPITAAIPAIPLKWLKKAHMAIWVQDLWPHSLAATGFIRNKLLLQLVGIIVKFIYKSADTLLVQSRAFVSPVSQYVEKNKIKYYPNSYLDHKEKQLTLSLELKALLKICKNHFSLIFAGNLGKAQSVETLVQVAINIKHFSDVKIILIGDGSMFEWLHHQKRTNKLDNLVLAGRYPTIDMPYIFDEADGLLVTLKKEEIFSYTIPSKVQAYLAAGRPVLASLDGEGARIVEESCAGFTSSAEDVSGLSQNIETFYHMKNIDRIEMGKAGRRYYLEHFEMKHQCKELIKLLECRINEGI